MSKKTVVECNGYEDGINDMLNVIDIWVELETEELYRDPTNNSWVSLLALAKLADELLS
jgi:hypothetical protein